MPMLRARSTAFLLSLSLPLLSLAAPSVRAADAPPTDPAEGLWSGTAGTALERVEVGFALRRSDSGALTFALTLPVANYFDLELPGAVERDGERIRFHSPDFGFTLDVTVRDGRLEGSFPGPDSPASFARALALPTAVAPPSVPPLGEPRWRKRIGGQIYASPVVFDGEVYVGTTGGTMNAFRAHDGKYRWSFAAGRPIFGAALATADALFFTCDDGRLHKLNRADGALLWRAELGDARAPRVLPHPAVFEWDWQGATPVVADGVVYVGAGDGGFLAIDAATGASRWRFATGGRIRNAAAIDGTRVVVGSADRHVYALDRGSGALLWKFETDGEIDTAPVVVGGRVVVGNRGFGLFALDAATGALAWKASFWGSWLESTPVVADGTLYVGSSDLRRVSALDPKDGRVIWRSDLFGWTWGTPVVVGGRIFAGAAGGAPYFIQHLAGIAELDRVSGRMLRRTPLPETPGAHQWGIGGSLALAGDLLIGSTIEGGLFAWPTD